MNMKYKCVFFAALSLCLLCACGGGEQENETLSSYTYGGDTIPSLEQVLPAEAGGRLISVLTPPASEDGEADSGEDAASDDSEGQTADSGESVPAGYVSYDYQQFAEGQLPAIIEDYVALLTNEENELRLESDGEFSADSEAGSVVLQRQAVLTEGDAPVAAETAAAAPADAEQTDGEEQAPAIAPYSSYAHSEDMRFRVRIDWTPTSCLITLDNVEGQDFASSLLGAGTLLSFSSAQALFSTVTPEEIGLPGESMDEYSLKPGPGFVMVDDKACLTVYVYGKNAQNTNSLMGTYFISSDGLALYRQVGETSSEVEAITFDDGIGAPAEAQTGTDTPAE